MLQTVWNGLVQGALYAVVALGYTMVYGILQLINFAHGEVLMLGAYTGVATLAGCAGSGALARFGLVPCLVAATLSSMLVTAAYGIAIERAAYRPLRHAPPLSALISAIGVSIVLQNFVMVGVGSAPVYAPTTHPELARLVSGTSWEVGGLTIQPLDGVILGTCVLLMGGLWIFVQRTRLGTAMRATSQDRTMASLVGIDVNRVISVTFGIGSALAAVAGLLVTLVTSQAKYDMGFLMGMKAFTAAVLGGIGNVPGAMLGGIVLGLAEAVGVDRFGSDYQHVYSFLLLLVVLVFRPKGILGERVAEKV